MTRQQSITIAQVACKIDEAKSRISSISSSIVYCETEEQYNDYLDQMEKAVHDWTVWTTVFDALEGK